MNNIFLKIIQPDLYAFINNATLDDCKLVMDKCYPDDFFKFICQLRDNPQMPIACQLSFPDQASKLPVVSFSLGSISSPITVNTMGYDNEELTTDELNKLSHLVETFSNSRARIAHARKFIHTASVNISVFTLNKIETSWISTIIEYILKLHQVDFEYLGFLNMSFTQSEPRLNQELFPLNTSSRLISIQYQFEKLYPIIELQQRAPFTGNLEITRDTDYAPLKPNIDVQFKHIIKENND